MVNKFLSDKIEERNPEKSRFLHILLGSYMLREAGYAVKTADFASPSKSLH